MKKLGLFILMLQAGVAWANWEKYSDTPTAVIYLDFASIRKTGDVYRFTHMYDMKEPYYKGIRSMRSESEIHCKLDQIRRLSLYAYSEPMLNGKMKLVSDKAEGWEAVKKSTSNEILYKRLCRLK